MAKIIFFAEINGSFCDQNIAYSSAGEQVQREIFQSLETQFPDDSVLCVSYQPFRIWPWGPFLVKSRRFDNYIFPAYLNIPTIKGLIFSFYFVFFGLRSRADYVFKYNINFLSSISLLFLSIFGGAKICIIIQDVCIINSSSILKRITNYFSRAALIISARFDGFIPITTKISTDFGMPAHKSTAFLGGSTAQTRRIMELAKQQPYANLRRRAVFAGALEPYNGVDLLINIWENGDIGFPLYIFGQGSLSKELKRASSDPSSNIRYMGQCDEEVVSTYVATSMVNICLRYSINIEEEYFFPSKFINLCAAPGLLVVNEFKNIPQPLIKQCEILGNDYIAVLQKAGYVDDELLRSQHERRLKWIKENGNWGKLLQNMMVLLNKHQEF